MNRSQLRTIINTAHDHLHAGNVEAAHETLHAAVGEVESMTADPEVQDACAAFLTFAEGKMNCGHTIGDLIGGDNMVTKCGACLQDGNRNKEPSKIAFLEKRRDQYRELVRRLAVEKDKSKAWYISKSWCPFWRELAFDLPSEAEQKAFLFE